MAITTMCNETDAGAVNVTEQWKNSSDNSDFKIFTRTQYQGCVLDTYERNGYDDSDFYATVWDEQSQSVKTIEYATTRGWTYCNGASVDATSEVIEKALQYEIKRTIPLYVQNDRELAATPAQHKVCKVIKGRKIAKGEIVTVIGRPEQHKYSMSRWAPVVTTMLVRLSNGNMLHTNIENLEVVNPEQYYTNEAALALEAERAVRNSNWRSMSYVGMSPRLGKALSRIGNL
jgi:hypothetical protein